MYNEKGWFAFLKKKKGKNGKKEMYNSVFIKQKEHSRQGIAFAKVQDGNG